MAINAHTNIVDKDKSFLIEPTTRAIKNTATNKELVQYDSLSEAYTFKMPRFIEGHDMAEASSIKVYYANKGTDGETIVDSSDVTSTCVTKGENDEVLVFTWDIPANATQKEGTLDFSVTFNCPIDPPDKMYIWSTKIYSGIVVNKGLRNSDEIIKRDPDAFDAILARVDEVETKAEASETKVDGFASNFETVNNNVNTNSENISTLSEKVTTLENKMSSNTGKVISFQSEVYNSSGMHRETITVTVDDKTYDMTSGYPSDLTFNTLHSKIQDTIEQGGIIKYIYNDVSDYGTGATEYVLNEYWSTPKAVSLQCNMIRDVEKNGMAGIIYVSHATVYKIFVNESGVTINDMSYGGSALQSNYRSITFTLGDDNTVTNIIYDSVKSELCELVDTTNGIPSNRSYSGLKNGILSAMKSGCPMIARKANEYFNEYYLTNVKILENSSNTDGISGIYLSYHGFTMSDNNIVSGEYCHIFISETTNKITYAMS